VGRGSRSPRQKRRASSSKTTAAMLPMVAPMMIPRFLGEAASVRADGDADADADGTSVCSVDGCAVVEDSVEEEEVGGNVSRS
jgi:hypothetical protein